MAVYPRIPMTDEEKKLTMDRLRERSKQVSRNLALIREGKGTRTITRREGAAIVIEYVNSPRPG